MAHKIEIERSNPEIAREEARKEAENWFQRRLAETKVLEEYGKATGKNMEEIIKGHLLGDYIGDIWNPVNATNFIFQGLSKGQRLANRKDLVELAEKERLSFLIRLETVNREEVAFYIPEEARKRLSQLTEKVRWQKWNSLEDIRALLEEKKRIAAFVKERWGEELQVAHNQFQMAEEYNSAHGLLTIWSYFKT